MTVKYTQDQFETAYNASFGKSVIEEHYPLRNILKPIFQENELEGLGIISGIVFSIKDYHDRELGEQFADLYTRMRIVEAKSFITSLPESEDRNQALEVYERTLNRNI